MGRQTMKNSRVNMITSVATGRFPVRCAVYCGLRSACACSTRVCRMCSYGSEVVH
jgi:hypothetical protein